MTMNIFSSELKDKLRKMRYLISITEIIQITITSLYIIFVFKIIYLMKLA